MTTMLHSHLRCAILLMTSSMMGCAMIWGFESSTEVGVAADSSADVATDGGSSCLAECAPAAPTDWQGPFAIFESSGAAPLPACPSGYSAIAYEGFATPTAAPATCACECDDPAGVACSAPTMSFFFDSSCTNGCGTANQPIGTSCTSLNAQNCNGSSRYEVAPSVASGGTCMPIVTRDIPKATWNDSVRLCAAPTELDGVGCNANQVCAPAVAAPYEARRCVMKMGIGACPAAYPTPHVYYTSSNDDRDCSTCTCGTRAGGSCAASVTVYKDFSCGSTGTTLAASTCTSANSSGYFAKAAAGVFAGGSCTPDGGAPTGAFTPTAPTTVCCTP